ncbi:MAG: PIN domain-containing protein [Deltaproteobacteria bacterium]|nr:PIN domain-containing protein [Deltaproteobacteria bacterium]
MFAIDTNIFIYAHFEAYPQHKKARQFCQQELLNGGDWCIGWQVFYEYLHITTHPRIHQRPLTLKAAIADLRPYLESEQCHILTQTPAHLQILEAIATDSAMISGNLVHDCHYATLLREHNIKRIYTADNDFKRFVFLEVIDPTI